MPCHQDGPGRAVERSRAYGQSKKRTAADTIKERWTGPLAFSYTLLSSHDGSLTENGVKGWTRRSLNAADLATKSPGRQGRRACSGLSRRLRTPAEPHVTWALGCIGLRAGRARCYGRQQRYVSGPLFIPCISILEDLFLLSPFTITSFYSLSATSASYISLSSPYLHTNTRSLQEHSFPVH